MTEYTLKNEYNRGPYNKFDDEQQYIRLSEGCPNRCLYCAESHECGIEPIYFEIPEIVRNEVTILDMNLLYKPKALEIIKDLGNRKVNNKVVHYQLTCGIDYRHLTPELSVALKQARFYNIRFAWDGSFTLQKKMKNTVELLTNAGHENRKISVFIIADYKISYEDCCKKLDLLKIWRVKVNDCYFDNTTAPNFQCNYWTLEQCKDFRKKCRDHNKYITFGYDPELKG